MENFEGTGVAIVTPFKKDSTLDLESMERMINHIISGGADYIVLMGTTGEAPTLTKDEKKTLAAFTANAIGKRVPLVIGIGGNDTREVLDQITTTDLKQAAAVLSVAPYYNKPTQRGIYEHFKAIALCSPVPVILYNVPGRTGCSISADTCLQLAHDFNNIMGVKEASGNMEQIVKIIKGKPAHFHVISGDDLFTLPLMAAGGSGVISVVANAYPADWSGMVKLCLNGNYKAARETVFRFLDILELLFTEGNPPGIKAVLSIMNLCQNNLRLPLVPVGNNTHSRIQNAVEELARR